MKLTIEQFDQIESYLNNDLADDDRVVFETLLANNTDLQAELTTQQNLRLGLRAIGIEQRLKAARKRYSEEEETPVIPMPVHKSNYRVWWAAASVVMVMGAGWLVYQNQVALSPEVVAMANQEMTFKTLPMPTATATQKAEWFLALAYIQQKEKKKARVILERISQDPTNPYQTKAQRLLQGF